jgi:hypothetical protein
LSQLIIRAVVEPGRRGWVWAFKIEKGELHLGIGSAKGEVPANFKGDTGTLVVLRKGGKKGRE